MATRVEHVERISGKGRLTAGENVYTVDYVINIYQRYAESSPLPIRQGPPHGDERCRCRARNVAAQGSGSGAAGWEACSSNSGESGRRLRRDRRHQAGAGAEEGMMAALDKKLAPKAAGKKE